MRDPSDDDNDGDGSGARVWKEFECPKCDAFNPVDDGFRVKDEVFCFYCGATFKVLDKDGRFRLKEA